MSEKQEQRSEKISQAIDVYLEKRKTRQYAGRLFKQGDRFVFEYDESYRAGSNPIPLGPDLPLDRKTHTSLKLFPSFEDRIPSKENPAYREYCRTAGISTSKKDPFVLLVKLARKGPSSFIFLPATEEESFDGKDMRRFRQNLRLSVREFASLFDISPAAVYRIENGKTSGRKILRRMADYAKDPRSARNKIRQTGFKINETKRRFAEDFVQSRFISPWTVTGADVERCNPEQAVELMRRLVLSECSLYGIPQSGVHVSDNLTAPDGGQDGQVFWTTETGLPRETNFFPRPYNCFQVKVGKVSPSQCQKELLNNKGDLKPAIRDVIKNRGAYILFSTKGVVGTGLQEREEALAEGLRAGGILPVADRSDGKASRGGTASVVDRDKGRGATASLKIKLKFYDANIISDWINSFPPVAVWFLKKVCGRSLTPWFSYEEWSREDPDYRSEFMSHQNLNNNKNAIHDFLSKPKRIVHLRGAGGLGKTRLALEVFRPILDSDYGNQKIDRSYSPKVKTSREERNLNNSSSTVTDSKTNETTEHQPEDLSPFVLYSPAEELKSSHLRDLKNFRTILVIDDCSREKAESFHKIAVQEDSQLSLLTIGTDSPLPEERARSSSGLNSPAFSHLQSPENPMITDTYSATQHISGSSGTLSPDGNRLTITLEPDEDIVKKILSKDQNIVNKWFRPEYLTLTQGFPLMAKLLREAGPRILQKDDIATIRKKMLWGLEEQNEEAEKVIKACALFDTVCIDDLPSGITMSGTQRGKEEVKYVAQKIAKMNDYDTFYKKIQLFKERRIIQKHGRFIQVRPKPLAVWLAGELIEGTPPESIEKQLSDMKVLKKSYQYPSLKETALESPPLHIFSDEERKSFQKSEADRLVLHGLRESFCKQMAWSADSELAQDLANKLCKTGGLFGMAEALNTEWGSRCFQHLSEVSPKTALKTLQEVFSNKTMEELKNIKDGRRNLIWTLQKLAVKKEFYLKAARLLLRFAEAENEDWSNNATGVFTGHFQLYLSGTEAEPKEKFCIIEEIQESKSVERKKIALQALGKALSTGPFSSSSDIMQTTSGKVFKDWIPKTYNEQWDYFRKALNCLVQFATKDENAEIQERACNFIAGNLGFLLKQDLYDEVKKVIKTVWLENSEQRRVDGNTVLKVDSLLKNDKTHQSTVSRKGQITINNREPHRVSAVNELSDFLEYNSKKITKDKKKRVEKMLDLLQSGQSLEDRIHSYITECSWSNLYNQVQGKEDKRYKESFQELIEDFINLIEGGERKIPDRGQPDLKSYTDREISKKQKDYFSEDACSALKLLFHGEQRNTRLFAKDLVHSLQDPFTFAVKLLDLAKEWKQNKNFSFTFPAGVLAELNHINRKKTSRLLDKIADDDTLRDFLISSYRYMDLRDQDITRLISVMDKMTPQALNELRDLTTGQRCKLVSADVIGNLMRVLTQKKESRFSWDALQIYTYYENKQKPKEKQTKLLPILYDVLTRDGLLSEKILDPVMNGHNYREAVDCIINSEYGSRFPTTFLSQIIKSESALYDFSVDSYTIKTCFKKILKKYPEPILSGITKILIASDNPKGNTKNQLKNFQQSLFKIQWIFEHNNSIGDPLLVSENEGGPLFVLTEKQLTEWCQTAPDCVPAFLAECLPLLNKNQESWTTFAHFLFDEYGDRESITQAVSKNLHTFSIIGGKIHYFKKLIFVLKQIENHRRENIRNFVDREISFLEKRINLEEEERKEREEFGIY